MIVARSHNGRIRYDRCPNCGAEGSVRRVYQCKAGHLFCERCSTPQHTELLRLRIDTCPTCGEQTYKFIGSTEWFRGSRVTSRSGMRALRTPAQLPKNAKYRPTRTHAADVAIRK
jgi:hypothetical protein